MLPAASFPVPQRYLYRYCGGLPLLRWVHDSRPQVHMDVINPRKISCPSLVSAAGTATSFKGKEMLFAAARTASMAPELTSGVVEVIVEYWEGVLQLEAI